MKLYSDSYRGTLVSLQELSEAKTALINQSGSALHALIQDAAQKASAKPINRLKKATGAKITTPVTIKALSDLYQTSRFVDANGNRLVVPVAKTPWDAARYFADFREALKVPTQRIKFGNTSSRSSSLSLNTSEGTQLSRNSSLKWSPIDEEIPPGAWQLSQKKRSQLKSLSPLSSDDKLNFQVEAAKVHRQKTEHLDDLKNFTNLKFVI